MKELIQIKTEKCLIVGCEKSMKESSRGLCCSHRAVAGEKVKKGKTTWEELEAQGLARKKFTKEEIAVRHMHPRGMRRYSSQFKNPHLD